MLQDIQQHLEHYVILASILLAGLLGFIWFQGTEPMQLATLTITGIGYVLWGIMHHLKEENLTITLVLEYVLTALILIVLVWGVFTNL
jgi:hypothetical protein